MALGLSSVVFLKLSSGHGAGNGGRLNLNARCSEGSEGLERVPMNSHTYTVPGMMGKADSSTDCRYCSVLPDRM